MAQAVGATVIPFDTLKNLQDARRFPPASSPPSPPASASPSSPYPISPSPSTLPETPSSPPTLPARQLTLDALSMPPAGGEKKKRARRTADGTRHRATIDLFVRLWAELRGGTYHVVGGRDGTCVRRLLAYPDATDEEISRRMRRALADPWFQRAGSLAVFTSRWSNYDRDSAAPAFGGARPVPKMIGSSRRVVGMNSDGSFKYAEAE